MPRRPSLLGAEAGFTDAALLALAEMLAVSEACLGKHPLFFTGHF